MKVIFLDHDGVMCLHDQHGTRFRKIRNWRSENDSSLKEEELPIEVRMDNFDSKAVKVLNEILLLTDAKIVVSSDWKLHASLEELQELYTKYGINEVPIDVTPRMRDFDPEAEALFSWKNWLERARICEIREWLKRHPEVTSWVAVDDLNMKKDGLENFVHTHRITEGIKQTGAKEKIINILNGV